MTENVSRALVGCALCSNQTCDSSDQEHANAVPETQPMFKNLLDSISTVIPFAEHLQVLFSTI